MRHPIPAGVFQPKPSGQEKKSDATTRAAQQIMDAETAAREAKTQRLRQARLAKEKAGPAIATTKVKSRRNKQCG